MDSFNQSLQILGSRTVDDAAIVGAGTDAAPPSVSPAGLPVVPYPVADPAGLRELQNAMGATDEEMAILQQLGGAGPIWVPIKTEAAVSMSAPDEEEDEEEADIVDLDRQRTAPEAPPEGVARGGGESAAAAAGRSGGATADVGEAVPDTSGRRAAAGAAAPVVPAVGSIKRQYGMRMARGAGSSVESLLATYEAKEMVCPSCHRFFLGVSALQQHVRVAHDGRVGPPPLKKSRSSVSGSSISKRPGGSVGWPVTSGAGVAGTVGSSSESGAAAAASALGTSADSPRRLACPHCRELLAGKDALAAHVAEEHPSSMATTGSATSTTPLGCSDEAEGLKTHISTALGGLLDRALNNLLERGLSAGGSAHLPSLNQPTLSLLQKLTARRPVTTSTSGSSTTGRPAPVYNTELAKQVRRQLAKPRPTGLALLRATSGVSDSHRYTCFYCESRFEQQSTRNRHMMRAHRNETLSKSKQAEPEDDADDVSGGEDSDHSWREPSPTNWTSETPGGDMGGDGDFLCSDCGINFGTPQEVLAHRKAEHSRPEPPPREASPAQGRGRNGRGRGAAASLRAASPPDGETIKQQAMAALRELGAQSRRGGGRGASQAKWGMRFPLAPASGAEGAVKLEKGAAFSLPLVRKSSGPGPRFASLERKRGKKVGAGSGGDEASPGPSPARLDVYEFADEETLAERPELQRRTAAGPVVATPDTTAGATSATLPAEEKESDRKREEQSTTSELSKVEATPRPEAAKEAVTEGDDSPTGRPRRRERRRKSCADFPSDLSDVLDESDSDGAPRAPAVARASTAPRGGRRPRRGAGRGGPGRGGAVSARRRGRGRGGGGGRRPAHTALAVTGAAPPVPVAVSASSDDDDEGDGPVLPPAKVPCRAATPDDSSQSSCDVKGAAAGPVGAAARRRRRRAKSDLLISVFRAKARHVSVSAAAAATGADSSDGAASGGAEPPV